MSRDPLRPCPPPGAHVDDVRTSSGLIAISRKHGAIAAAARAAEETIRTGVKSVVQFGAAEGDIARLASDVPKDPRTPRQIDADAWIHANGINTPAPDWAVSPRKR